MCVACIAWSNCPNAYSKLWQDKEKLILMLVRPEALAIFDGYVRNFNLADPRISLKYEHTMKVAKLCEEIATSNGMSSDDVDLAWLCGLLHDIGRFEQLRYWGTFRDTDSMSHAEIGVAVLDGKKMLGLEAIHEGNLLARFTEDVEWAQVIRSAIGTHSDYKLPIDLDSRTREFCEILRDADKIDIIRVFSQSSCEAVLGITHEDFLGDTISDAAMIGFREHRCLGPGDRKTHLDRLVGVVCLAFEIVNDSAIDALCEYGYMGALVNRPFGMDASFVRHDTRVKWGEISTHMARFLHK